MSSTQHILITGATGFLATRIIHQLIEAGGYSITGTTRDASKAQNLYTTFPKYKGVVTFVSVPDFTAPNAFDEVFKTAETPFDYVLHTASPLPNSAGGIEGIIYPGPQGVQNLFTAAKQFGGNIKRIILTSSGVDVVNYADSAEEPRTYDETMWNPITAEIAIKAQHPALAYFASKTLAERAAWDFIESEKPNFDLVALLPVVIIGPQLLPVNSADEVENGSKVWMYGFFNGEKTTTKDETYFFYTHVDVRDVARAHVDSLKNSKAGGERILLYSGTPMTPSSTVGVLNKIPELKGRVAKDESDLNTVKVVPEEMSNQKSKQIFGWDYITMEQSLTDSAKQILEHEKQWSK